MLLLDRDSANPRRTRPQQGVIDDARRIQRARRKRAASALLGAGLVAGVAWASSGAATRSHTGRADGGSLGSSRPHHGRAPAFNVRLVPMLNLVGVAGWCEVLEEHGVTGGSACGGVSTPSQPFLQIYGQSESKSPDEAPVKETQVAVTDPQITSVLVDGHRRVQTTLLPGLPYGLRGVRVVTRAGATLTALDAHGHPVAQNWVQPPRQASVRRWRPPQRSPNGACDLRASRLPGLAVRGGAVATSIRAFPGRLVGHAFLPCAATEYTLLGVPMKAFVVLDAAQPSTRAAELPSFHPVRAAPGIFAAGDLTAMRSGNAWLVAEQGRGFGERMVLLRHLTATVNAGR
jgi:hypothetical protein